MWVLRMKGVPDENFERAAKHVEGNLLKDGQRPERLLRPPSDEERAAPRKRAR